MIDQILLLINDEEIIEFVVFVCDECLVVRVREDLFLVSSISMDELINYVGLQIGEGYVFWIYVILLFIGVFEYDEIVQMYFWQLENGYDLFMIVNEIQGFIWDDGGFVNYDCSVEKWLRIQILVLFYEVNSGVFIVFVSVY